MTTSKKPTFADQLQESFMVQRAAISRAKHADTTSAPLTNWNKYTQIAMNKQLDFDENLKKFVDDDPTKIQERRAEIQKQIVDQIKSKALPLSLTKEQIKKELKDAQENKDTPLTNAIKSINNTIRGEAKFDDQFKDEDLVNLIYHATNSQSHELDILNRCDYDKSEFKKKFATLEEKIREIAPEDGMYRERMQTVINEAEEALKAAYQDANTVKIEENKTKVTPLDQTKIKTAATAITDLPTQLASLAKQQALCKVSEEVIQKKLEADEEKNSKVLAAVAGYAVGSAKAAGLTDDKLLAKVVAQAVKFFNDADPPITDINKARLMGEAAGKSAAERLKTAKESKRTVSGDEFASELGFVAESAMKSIKESDKTTSAALKDALSIAAQVSAPSEVHRISAEPSALQEKFSTMLSDPGVTLKDFAASDTLKKSNYPTGETFTSPLSDLIKQEEEKISEKISKDDLKKLQDEGRNNLKRTAEIAHTAALNIDLRNSLEARTTYGRGYRFELAGNRWGRNLSQDAQEAVELGAEGATQEEEQLEIGKIYRIFREDGTLKHLTKFAVLQGTNDTKNISYVPDAWTEEGRYKAAEYGIIAVLKANPGANVVRVDSITCKEDLDNLIKAAQNLSVKLQLSDNVKNKYKQELVGYGIEYMLSKAFSVGVHQSSPEDSFKKMIDNLAEQNTKIETAKVSQGLDRDEHQPVTPS